MLIGEMNADNVMTATSQMPVQGPAENASKGAKVTMHYTYDDASGNYTQVASINDKAVSELPTKDGHAQGWGSAVECAESNCGTVGAHCKRVFRALMLCGGFANSLQPGSMSSSRWTRPTRTTSRLWAKARVSPATW